METNQDESNRSPSDSSTAAKDKQTLEQEHKEKINKLVSRTSNRFQFDFFPSLF